MAREPRLATYLDRWLTQVNDGLLEKLRQVVQGEEPWPLLLCGPVGTGKTCAALALADCCATASYHTVDDMADAIMDHSKDRDTDPFRDEACGVGTKDLCILDELGARAKCTELEYKAVKRMADVRAMGEHKAVIFITNLRPKEIQGYYDDRIASRLTAGTVFELTGEDRRRG